MNEMEFHDGNNEEDEIYYGWWQQKQKQKQGMVTHVGHLLVPEEENAFNVCLEKKGSWSCKLPRAVTDFQDYRTIQIETSQIECFLDLVNFAKKYALPTAQVNGNS